MDAKRFFLITALLGIGGLSYITFGRKKTELNQSGEYIFSVKLRLVAGIVSVVLILTTTILIAIQRGGEQNILKYTDIKLPNKKRYNNTYSKFQRRCARLLYEYSCNKTL